jgi:hypothetical protein
MANEIERVNYFDHQFLTAKDFTDEQNYHIQMRNLQNRYMFLPGIVDGLTLEIGSDKRSVTITPGMAINQRGQAIIVSERLTWPPSPTDSTPPSLYLTLTERPKKDGHGNTYRVEQVPEVTPVNSQEAILLAMLTWTGQREIQGWQAGEKATVRGVDLTPFVRKTGETETILARLNVGGGTPNDVKLQNAQISGVKFFVKGDVAIEGNLLVSSNVYTPGGASNASLEEGYPRGSDLAEVYASCVPLEAGEVVCLHPDDDSIVRSTVPNDPLVFGVISTAPAHVLGKANGLGFPVALTGRVPCKVVAENGPIRRGDLLTTSSTPGHAMKARPLRGGDCSCLQPGTVMGKALGALPAGAGLIEVFVFLR